MSVKRKLINLGLVNVAAMTVSALIGAAPASASANSLPIGSTVRGVQGGDGTRLGALTTCTESFSGRLTQTDPSGFGGGTFAITEFSFTSCDNGARVSLNALPQALRIDPIGLWSIGSMDVKITTRTGTCRYTGHLGDMTGYFSGTMLHGSGLLFRKSSGCGGPSSIQATQAELLLDADGNPPRL